VFNPFRLFLFSSPTEMKMSITRPEHLQSAYVLTLALNGLEVLPLHIEVDVGKGPAGLQIRGVSEGSARESAIRVHSALQLMGVDLRKDAFGKYAIEVTIELAETKKIGVFDLAIAVALLVAFGHIPAEAPGSTLILGELSLTGAVRPVRGVLPALRGAVALGFKRAIIPRANAAEAAHVRGMDVLVAEHLSDIPAHFKSEKTLDAVGEPPLFEPLLTPGDIDLADVRGHHAARRAIEIAAAGGHNLLLMGLPGSGKTMLVRRATSILPPLTMDEALEVSSIYSVAGLLSSERGLLTSRPFRAPHHTVSEAGLVGGGDPARPGEVSLAHRGCLFLDELLEFRRNTVGTLRHALGEGQAVVYRKGTRTTFPVKPLVIAAVNPCPCGYAGASARQCICTTERMQLYRARLWDPLFDWLDLRTTLAPIDVAQLQGPRGESSAVVRARVEHARGAQAERVKLGEVKARLNATLLPGELERVAQPDAHGAQILSKAIERLGLSAPLYGKVLRVARTIADLEGSEVVRALHVAEALQVSGLGHAANAASSS